MRHPIKLEDHHPDLMKMSEETRRIVNAFQSGGWTAVDRVVEEITEEAYRRGQLNERGGGLS